MNNIYVDELPKRCSDCVCWDYSYDCNLLDKEDFDWNGENLKHTKCPLKLLSTRLAEERMKVVQEIKQTIEFNANYSTDADDDWLIQIKESYFLELLDQIERGE